MTVTEDPACPTVMPNVGRSSAQPSAPRRTDRGCLAPPTSPLLAVVDADLPASLAGDSSRPYTNLDYVASAPALREVADHIAGILSHHAGVHRGSGDSAQAVATLSEAARATVSRFFACRGDDVVIFTDKITEAMNLLAGCVPAGQDVVVLDIEQHPDLLPWPKGRTRVMPVAATLATTLDRLDAELARRPAALLAVSGASNVTGEQLPIGRLAQMAHRHGARISVDAAQLAAHRRIDLIASEVDYLTASGHALYAPWGAGVLVGRRDWLDAAPPYLAGDGATRDVTLEGTAWQVSPGRREAGSRNVIGAVALAKACEVIDAQPEGALELHESLLRERLTAGLTSLPGVRVHRMWPDSPSILGVVCFSVDGHEAGFVAAYLSAEHGVGVRPGTFCAHPLAEQLGRADGVLRATFGVGSTSADVDRLLTGVEQLVVCDSPQLTHAAGDRWAAAPGALSCRFVTIVVCNASASSRPGHRGCSARGV